MMKKVHLRVCCRIAFVAFKMFNFSIISLVCTALVLECGWMCCLNCKCYNCYEWMLNIQLLQNGWDIFYLNGMTPDWVCANQRSLLSRYLPLNDIADVYMRATDKYVYHKKSCHILRKSCHIFSTYLTYLWL